MTIHQDGRYTPLEKLYYIKFMSMFYGVEELADEIYDAIVENYQCLAGEVQAAIAAGNWPEGRFITAMERVTMGRFQANHEPWWDTMAFDAGAQVVNLGDEDVFAPASPNQAVADDSWAMFDMTQYTMGTDLESGPPRLNGDQWRDTTGFSRDIWAVDQENIWLTDVQTNRNREHSMLNHLTHVPLQDRHGSTNTSIKTSTTAVPLAQTSSSATS